MDEDSEDSEGTPMHFGPELDPGPGMSCMGALHKAPGQRGILARGAGLRGGREREREREREPGSRGFAERSQPEIARSGNFLPVFGINWTNLERTARAAIVH